MADTQRRGADETTRKLAGGVPPPEREKLKQHAREAFDPVEEASEESFPASDAPGWR